MPVKKWAFQRSVDSNQKPFIYKEAILIILSPDLAYDKADVPPTARDALDAKTIPAEDAVLTLMMKAPRLAAKLYDQAKANPRGDLENQYIAHYDAALSHPRLLTRDQKTHLNEAFNSLHR